MIPFIVLINFRMDSYTIEEIESSLMAQEARFEKNNKALDFALSANIATKF